MKRLIILRGLPGAGKSTKAQELKALYEARGKTVRICSSDSYMVDAKGKYKFDRARFPETHGKCRADALRAMAEGVNVIIIDNMNSTSLEYGFYVDFGVKYGYEVRYKQVGKVTHESASKYYKRQLHGAPWESYSRAITRWDSCPELYEPKQLNYL